MLHLLVGGVLAKILVAHAIDRDHQSCAILSMTAMHQDLPITPVLYYLYRSHELLKFGLAHKFKLWGKSSGCM